MLLQKAGSPTSKFSRGPGIGTTAGVGNTTVQKSSNKGTASSKAAG